MRLTGTPSASPNSVPAGKIGGMIIPGPYSQGMNRSPRLYSGVYEPSPTPIPLLSADRIADFVAERITP